MDRLLVMRSFVTVASVGSFAGAAKEMRTSTSMVSRHVADLEKQVGACLVNRTARSVSLTESGVRYHAFAKRILDEIRARAPLAIAGSKRAARVAAGEDPEQVAADTGARPGG